MKNKPISHKATNTFHFQTYAERLSNIDVCVYRQGDSFLSTPDGDKTSYFWEAFDKWSDLNFSISYEEFRKDIGDEIQNLKQLVHRKDDIVEVFLKHLNKRENLALPALLELTVALARDLQDELYPRFPEFFKAITSHLYTQDTELLEKLFLCLAFLFKFFMKYIIKDIKRVYTLFSSLLDNTNKEHIRNFACQSFAILVRKVRAREELFTFIFQNLQQNPQRTYGVGQLFFEVVRGVKEQFHYSLEPVFKLLLKYLGKEKLSPNYIEEALHQMLISMANYTIKIHCVDVQEIFSDVISELLNDIQGLENDAVDKIKHLNRIISLLLFWINFKNGKLITSENKLISAVINLPSIKDLPQYCMNSVMEVISSVMKSDCLNLPVEKMKIIVSQIYAHSEESGIFFTRKMFKYGMFEKDILPVLLSMCLKMIESGQNTQKIQALEILSESIKTLKPLSESEDDVKSFSKLYLHLSSTSKNCRNEKSVHDILQNFLIEILECDDMEQNLSTINKALICLPHIRFINKEQMTNVIHKLSLKIHETMLSNVIENQLTVVLSFTLYQAYFAYLVITKDDKRIADCFNTAFFMDLLKKYSDCINILRMVEYYLNSLSKAPVIEDLPEIILILIQNLASPFHLVRLFTLKILKAFDLEMDQTQKKTLSVLNICLQVENIPLDLQIYREKLKWLAKLEYQFIEKNLPAAYAEHLTKAAIYFLLGMLYVNFKLLWEPSIKILETFAHGTPEIFWNAFYPHLSKSFEFCVKHNSGEDVFKVSESSRENVDIFNHHMLLWKAMEKFSDVVERKNKGVVPLLLQFMVKLVESPENIKEMKNENLESIQSKNESISDVEMKDEVENIKEVSNENLESIQSKNESSFDVEMKDEAEEDAEIDYDDSEEEEEDESKDELDNSRVLPSKKKKYVRHFQVTKTLAAYLTVFSKFKYPKGNYKADELEKLYKELLTYSDPTIQKLAFDCILTFNYKYLTPYRENFYRILDSKTFKNEIVLFNVDTENHVIAEEHRMGALGILMRILYGKVLCKIMYRPMVLRFLAGCTAEELKLFFELVFFPFKEQMEDDTLVAVKKITEHLDPSSIVPIRKQQSALNTLGLIFQHLGNLVPELLPSLLKVLLIITATSSTLLKKQVEVLPYCINLLKTVRTQAILTIVQYFKIFEDYKYHPEEIDAIYESIIWTMLPRLEIESVNQPSPLLKLFSTWSDNPRYFILFAKHHESQKSLTPLPHIIDLYCSSNSKTKVVDMISKIVYQLLCTEDKDNEEVIKKITPIEINFCIQLPEIKIDNAPCSLGTQLLYPYIDKILRRFETTVSNLARRKFKRRLPAKNLTILLRISHFLENSQLCFKLIQLLPPFIMGPKTDAESEVLILNTISALLKKSENPDYFIKLFAPLFGKLSNKNSRTALVALFSAIAEIRPEMQKLASIISKINAYDTSMMDEPDYQSRLDGHKEILEVIPNMDEASFNVDFIRIAIFNSSFTLRTCEDLGLRSSATYMLQELVKILFNALNSSTELRKILMYQTLLPEIQKGLKNKSEPVRHEFIQVLQTVLCTWKDLPDLKELVMLCNDETDLDFWENIRHLQKHRRSRALMRFANILSKRYENNETISIHCLTSYMLPIVSSFLFNDAYKRDVHVIDAAIKTLGSIALHLPWRNYEQLLKQYLQMLRTDTEHHKTIIKIVVSLLDSFHFETSSKRKILSTESLEVKRLVLDTTRIEPQSLVPKEDGEMNCKVSSSEVNLTDTTSDESFKIFTSIKKNILPLLHQSLMKNFKKDSVHKLAGHQYPEDEEILRIPIALAMVKLLQKLPSESLEGNLTRLFLRMCELLKSGLPSIRETTRDTLLKMMESLGPQHFKRLLTEMLSVMKRGHQVHVMIFTVNAVLVKLSNMLKSGNLDNCAVDLTQICMMELFTDVAEEKEVEKIIAKAKEAKNVKSYSIFKILSTFVSEEFLLEMIKPLKEELGKRYSHKNMKKVSECLKHIALGLSKNEGMKDKQMLIFIHAIINESIPGLNKKKQKIDAKPLKFERPDSFLIPKEPGRIRPPAKINPRTTDHVFVEFGLQIFYFCLKKGGFEKTEKEILEMLDPFVAQLADCLSSNHTKIITLALQCFQILFKYSLPSFKTVAKKIVNTLFIIVNKYASIGMAQGENFQMVVMCFKVFTIFVKYPVYYTFKEEQLQSLLSYIEQDMYDHLRQTTAFTLLQAILSKKLQIPELPEVMNKIAEMSITSEETRVRLQCRQVCLQYMLDYPLGKKLERIITFFLAQLQYPLKYGRISALEIIHSMLNSFPERVLEKHSAMYLLPLASRLVNDDPECRKMSAECIKILLKKIGHDGRLPLFSISLSWFQAEKISLKRLGAQLCGMFAEIEGEQFEHHLHEILPLITELIRTYKTSEQEETNTDKSTDHFLYHVLNALTKMMSSCPIIKKEEFADHLMLLFDELKSLILYPHIWVRFTTNQLFNLLFSSHSVEEVEKAVCKKKKDNSIFLNTRQKLRDLLADFITQLQSPFLNEKFGEQTTRNLIYLAKIISRLPENSNKDLGEGDDCVKITIRWMIQKLCNVAKREVADNPTSTQKRKCVFMFMAAFAHVIEKDQLLPLLNDMLVPFCREVNDGSKNASSEELKNCVQEALDLIKTVVGVEEFSTAYADVQGNLFKRKLKRKHERAIQAVANPKKHILRKNKKHLKMHESKRQKILLKKGKKKVKKAKFSDFVINS
ncbi:small subunit processome component 20 homolog [Trichonephila clavata]|uniref:Small subunit processome component 20 homolog n=1 Tax=Trichonephila clavata TaxID=2740835 RepID=A0A8X6K587_TRICU|nr:small subunit processome component 20 homolog [Trichonephila clavata]